MEQTVKLMCPWLGLCDFANLIESQTKYCFTLAHNICPIFTEEPNNSSDGTKTGGEE